MDSAPPRCRMYIESAIRVPPAESAGPFVPRVRGPSTPPRHLGRRKTRLTGRLVSKEEASPAAGGKEFSMPTRTKLDMKRDLTPLYAPSTDPVLVEVPPLRYLTIDGVIPEGNTGPGTDPDFQEAIGALYGVTYTLKFESKASGRDFVVMPLEGLFWADGTEDAPPLGASPMRWTLMIVQPPWITQDAVSKAAG